MVEFKAGHIPWSNAVQHRAILADRLVGLYDHGSMDFHSVAESVRRPSQGCAVLNLQCMNPGSTANTGSFWGTSSLAHNARI